MVAKNRVCAAALHTSAFAGLSAWLFAGTAGAQANAEPPAGEPQQIEEIVVTGSSIRGIKPVGSDVVGITLDQIQQQGVASATDVLRSLPQVSNLGADDSRNSAGAAQRAIANIGAASGINLRGIGVEATLTLLDGQRVAPEGGDGRFFDPSSIPLIAIQRVEVVPDGASGIYGSDAVAGVVNLIPLTRFDGEQLQIRYGGADGIDQTVVDGVAGGSWDRGRIVAAVEYNDRSHLAAGDRPDQYVNSPVYGATSGNTFPANLANNAGPPPFAFASGTHRFNDVSGSGVLNTANLAATGANGAGLAGNWVGADALPAQSRKSGYVYAEQDLSDTAELYVQSFVTERDFTRYIASPTTSSLAIPGLAAGAFANAYNLVPAAVGANYNFLAMLGNGKTAGFERAFQFRLGSKIALGQDWNLNVIGSYGQVEDKSTTSNQVNSQALAAAASCVNPTRPNGLFAPPITNVATCHNAATAFDPFSDLQPGTPGFGYPSLAAYQGVMNAIDGYSFINPTFALGNVNAKADGPLFSLPGGAVKLAVGADFQDLQRTGQNGGTLAGASASELDVVQYPLIHRNTESAFAELYVPIIGAENAMPGMKALSLSVAVRYDNYQDGRESAVNLPGFRQNFDTTNPKVGATWEATDDLSFRGSYGTSFRAPVLGDYAPGAPTLGIPFTVTPAVASALGLPASCANAGTCYMLNIQGGTSNLKPETANTWSLGVTYKPDYLPGLEISLSYYNIDYENQIVVPGTGPWQSSVSYALALKNAGLIVPSPALGKLGTFNPTTIRGYLSYGNAFAANPAVRYTPYAGLPGYLFANGFVPTSLLLNSLSVNSGQLLTDGLDFTVAYGWTGDYGTFRVSDVGTLVLNYGQSLARGTPVVSYLNQINNPVRFQTRAQFGWNNNTYGADFFVTYVNAYDNPGLGTIPGYATVDLTLAYTPAQLLPWLGETRVSLAIQNLFDSAPPATINIPNQMAYDPQEASAIGRFVSVTLSQKF